MRPAAAWLERVFLQGVPLFGAGLIFASQVQAQIRVDAYFDEPQWQEAVRCDDWHRIEPFALDEPRYRNELRILSAERGLAAAFVIDQPPGERRIRPRTPRDAENLVGDTVALMIDFDATGQVGYEFSVGLGGGVRDGLITNQNHFDRDWDGSWQYAVRETEDQWFVELFIPWSDIRLRDSQAETRSIAIYATRYLSERAERYACPGISSETGVFLSDFKRLEVRRHTAGGRFDLVPYASVITDLIRDDMRMKAGADLSWKISPRMWLTATLNPDFGQIESDELVVDFSAIETVFTDKRPFFTQNHGLFDLRTPANGQLIYTRRIGGSPDHGPGGSTDIDGAFRLTGSVGPLIYGGFVAWEDGYAQDQGRLFSALRLAAPLEHGRLGYLATWTDRPALDRDALINALDFEVTPNNDWRVAGQFIRTDIGTAGLDLSLPGLDSLTPPPRLNPANATGYESWLQVDFNQSASMRHSLKLLHIDDRFDLNDLGYMERNALKQVEWDIRRRVASTGGSRISGETQRLYALYRENTRGEHLPSRLQVSRDVQYASIWRSYQELRYLSGGMDDLLSRGNGPVRIDARLDAYFDVTSPRIGDWQFTLGGYVFQQGLRDYSLRLQMLTSWYPTETLTLRLDLLPQYFGDWLLWEHGREFATYRARRLDLDFRLDWIPAPRHELRVKWQWIGIDADILRTYRSDPDGRLRILDAAEYSPPGFTVGSLGLQIRYRYEMGPLSEIFLVYGRGGYDMLRDDRRDIPRLLWDLGSVRDADQIMLKLRYRL
ncbi:hypothetical protein ACG33_15250 [Steroidobacter denitrificans]|uniref:DUF5916 domain-containing protein n=1 Tax=Steroidobacter denitrificans TaxID=465721 RepID=A0A127FES2_STEDE|nr:DUF5916 domain-containing protein [Steroidobacter denitrificans]AMN48429.1 hypothetical protein ACG33_15250 [Steroidobacter denitrificans]